MTDHPYPSKFKCGRGVHKDLDEAWDLLDTIKPGIIHDDVRYYLAGAIWGLMAKVRKEERGSVIRQMRRP